MFTFQVTDNRDEMIIFLDGKPIYKAGYHRLMDHKATKDAFEDCVSRLKTQLRQVA